MLIDSDIKSYMLKGQSHPRLIAWVSFFTPLSNGTIIMMV